MTSIIIIILASIGCFAILFAAIGVLRMPDFYLRLSVTVKAATLGVGLLLLCAAIIFPDVSVTTKVFAILFFIVLTAPIAAHIIAKAAYFTQTPQWEGTVMDELKQDYHKEKPKDVPVSNEEGMVVLEDEDQED